MFNLHQFCNLQFRSISFGLLITLPGCTSVAIRSPATSEQPRTISTYFDYQLISPQNQAMTMQGFLSDIEKANVVLVGEWHGHSGIHRFQTDLLQAAVQKNSNLALSMEQFTRDRQAVVDQYLAGEIGEATLIKAANAWPNYRSDYRPLVEVAKVEKLDVLAANAPKQIVSCIAKEGIDYINRLPEKERAWLAETISLKDSAYKKRFMASSHHGDELQNSKQFAAQVTWDETMAESIVRYLEKHPDKKVIHTAGKFHVEDGLGIASSILARAPHLSVVIITPVDAGKKLEKMSGDYRLQVLGLPQQFVKNENMIASFKTLSERNNNLLCIK
ncbi:ChaN family lipoprotein [Psychromonas sp.]|uniref:ChaN family lipoprotein n=1 Tax=Psychromonas sp. TaxID=1884585 RepID=UPI00356605F8